MPVTPDVEDEDEWDEPDECLLDEAHDERPGDGARRPDQGEFERVGDPDADTGHDDAGGREADEGPISWCHNEVRSSCGWILAEVVALPVQNDPPGEESLFPIA